MSWYYFPIPGEHQEFVLVERKGVWDHFKPKNRATKKELFVGRRVCKRDIPMYKCPECGRVNGESDLEIKWDWSGPKCPECEFGGMDMFAVYMERTPIMSGKGEFVEFMERILKKNKR